MKKLTLLFLLILVSFPFTYADEYEPMVVEGRTWWYHSESALYPFRNEEAEFGVSIYPEIELEGKKWNKILLTKRTDNYLNPNWNYSDKDIIIDAIREENRHVYSYNVRSGYWPLTGHDFSPFFDPDEEEIEIYNFDSEGSIIKFGCPSDYALYRIESIETEENSGHSYRKYNSVALPEGEGGRRILYKPEIVFYEGIGSVDECAFFHPIWGGVTAVDRFNPPVLRYVTDADGNIIFEGIGGMKLWEMTGLEAVSVDAEACRWYNLQGLEVAEPDAPGIYIRHQGNESRKVLVK